MSTIGHVMQACSNFYDAKCVSVACSFFKRASTVYLNISRSEVSLYSLVISLCCHWTLFHFKLLSLIFFKWTKTC